MPCPPPRGGGRAAPGGGAPLRRAVGRPAGGRIRGRVGAVGPGRRTGTAGPERRGRAGAPGLGQRPSRAIGGERGPGAGAPGAGRGQEGPWEPGSGPAEPAASTTPGAATTRAVRAGHGAATRPWRGTGALRAGGAGGGGRQAAHAGARHPDRDGRPAADLARTGTGRPPPRRVSWCGGRRRGAGGGAGDHGYTGSPADGRTDTGPSPAASFQSRHRRGRCGMERARRAMPGIPWPTRDTPQCRRGELTGWGEGAPVAAPRPDGRSPATYAPESGSPARPGRASGGDLARTHLPTDPAGPGHRGGARLRQQYTRWG